jgi:hypothetical protein
MFGGLQVAAAQRGFRESQFVQSDLVEIPPGFRVKFNFIWKPSFLRECPRCRRGLDPGTAAGFSAFGRQNFSSGGLGCARRYANGSASTSPTFAIPLIEKRLKDAFPGIKYEVHGTPKDGRSGTRTRKAEMASLCIHRFPCYDPSVSGFLTDSPRQAGLFWTPRFYLPVSRPLQFARRVLLCAPDGYILRGLHAAEATSMIAMGQAICRCTDPIVHQLEAVPASTKSRRMGGSIRDGSYGIYAEHVGQEHYVYQHHRLQEKSRDWDA